MFDIISFYEESKHVCFTTLFSLSHASEAFSLEFSIFAILEPNCIALLGCVAVSQSPSWTAANRSSNFSPSPLGKVKSAWNLYIWMFNENLRDLLAEQLS